MYLTFIKLVFFYSFAALIFDTINSDKVKNKFKYASYYLTIIHQGFVLPYYYIPNIVNQDFERSNLIFLSNISYFIVDLFINRHIIKKDFKFLFHHILTIFLCIYGIKSINFNYKFCTESCLVILEMGSLWLSVTDIYPTKLNYKLRFYFYILSRILAINYVYEYIILDDGINFYIKLIPSVAMYLHNALIGYYLYRGTKKVRN